MSDNYKIGDTYNFNGQDMRITHVGTFRPNNPDQYGGREELTALKVEGCPGTTIFPELAH